MEEVYDVVVIGAGIFGSCAAYHCQKRGLKTILVEQFELPHKNGSSHGLSRIIRYAHTEREYVPLVSDAYEQIAELEAKTGEALWKQTGLLWVSTPQEVASMSKILEGSNIEHETISGEEVAHYSVYESFFSLPTFTFP
ncbi:FAD dependent oxidoreductase [Oesophagostomum dentatum]|uniref:FAD dependent oxidoreductase n=1 Tax=Oesophagostomum dentatum TaxID=61180 RepID=A0A0B1TQH9_OESDE|nr:FAD dependent oxidoreductase [Oesophagostomum dentatum]